jgi:SAM-dependent methyltransferase
MPTLRAFIRSIAPAPAVVGYHHARRYYERRLNAHRTLADVFEDIYRRGGWGGAPGEWCSGSGSASEQTAGYLAAVAVFVRERGVRSVVDLGCGDFCVGAGIAALGVDYTGVDIVPGLIERNSRSFASEHVRFTCLDITRDELPDGDLALVRQVFQHLSNAEITAAIARLDRFRYALITEHYPAPGRMRAPNADKPHGGCTRVVDGSAVCLDEPPFGLRVEPFHEAPALNPLVAPGETLRTWLVTNTAASRGDGSSATTGAV